MNKSFRIFIFYPATIFLNCLLVTNNLHAYFFNKYRPGLQTVFTGYQLLQS